MNIKNAVIENMSITNDDHGCLSSWIYLDYGNGEHQGFGGYALYLPKSYTHHQLLSHAGHWIFRIMEIAEVSKWSELKGKTIRVKAEHSKVHEIGHIVEEDWFNPEVDFMEVK
jgi:hypothetical protein